MRYSALYRMCSAAVRDHGWQGHTSVHGGKVKGWRRGVGLSLLEQICQSNTARGGGVGVSLFGAPRCSRRATKHRVLRCAALFMVGMAPREPTGTS